MSEEIKKQETMDDFAQEIEASFNNFRDSDMEIWDKLEQMKEDKEAFEVTIEGIVKGGAIAYVEGIRAFIPVSKLSLEYVKEPEEFLKKTLMVRVFEVDHFVLTWRVYNNIVGFEHLQKKQVDDPDKHT